MTRKRHDIVETGNAIIHITTHNCKRKVTPRPGWRKLTRPHRFWGRVTQESLLPVHAMLGCAVVGCCTISRLLPSGSRAHFPSLPCHLRRAAPSVAPQRAAAVGLQPTSGDRGTVASNHATLLSPGWATAIPPGARHDPRRTSLKNTAFGGSWPASTHPHPPTKPIDAPIYKHIYISVIVIGPSEFGSLRFGARVA